MQVIVCKLLETVLQVKALCLLVQCIHDHGVDARDLCNPLRRPQGMNQQGLTESPSARADVDGKSANQNDRDRMAREVLRYRVKVDRAGGYGVVAKHPLWVVLGRHICSAHAFPLMLARVFLQIDIQLPNAAVKLASVVVAGQSFDNQLPRSHIV